MQLDRESCPPGSVPVVTREEVNVLVVVASWGVAHAIYIGVTRSHVGAGVTGRLSGSEAWKVRQW